MPATIFSGNDVKALKANLDLNGGPKILSGTVDPSSVATAGNPSSLYLNTSSGVVYRKTDSGTTTNWVSLGGAAAAAAGVNIEALIDKAENEHYDIVSPPYDNAVHSGFRFSKPDVDCRLLADHTSGSTIYLAVNPKFLSDSDTNLDSTTSWTAQGAGASLTTSGTKKIGSASLSFDKNGTATNARIQFDRGSANLSINGFSNVFFWINLPSITNLSNVELRIDVDNTNYQTWTATTDQNGTALAVGWQLMKFDVSTGGSASGTGWDVSKLARYVHVGVNTSSAAQTYTAILVDSFMFSQQYPERLIKKGFELTISDTSNVNDVIVDQASTNNDGIVTLSASLTQAYSGGSSSKVRRQTAQIVGDNAARMEQGLSGTIADQQNIRLQAVLNESLTSQTFKAAVNCGTSHVFSVSEVTSSTAIKVTDPADSTANLVNTKVIHVFKTHYNTDGKPQYEYRDLDLTISSSSHSAGVTTINTGTNTGIAVGDIVVLKVQDTKIALTAASGANVSYQTPTVENIIVKDIGVGYPYAPNVWAHWTLSGTQGYKTIKGTSGKDLTVNGTLTTNSAFKYGQFATSNWTDSNYFSLAGTDSTAISGASTSVEISLWFYATSGVGRQFINRYYDAGSQGYRVYTTAGNLLYFEMNSTIVANPSFTPNQWNHLVVRVHTSNPSYFYLNAVKSATTSSAVSTDSGSNFHIGRYSMAGSPATGMLIADVLILNNSTALTIGQVESIYNRGVGAPFGGSGVSYRYSQASLTGQVLDLKSTMDRTTDACIPYITSAGAIKV